MLSLDILTHLDCVEGAMLTITHHLSHIEWLGQVRWLLCTVANYLTDSIDDLSATKQLRSRKRKLLVRTKGDLCILLC